MCEMERYIRFGQPASCSCAQRAYEKDPWVDLPLYFGIPLPEDDDY